MNTVKGETRTLLHHIVFIQFLLVTRNFVTNTVTIPHRAFLNCIMAGNSVRSKQEYSLHVP